MFNPACLPTPIGKPWASALTHSGWCGDYAMASVLFLCCLHPTPFRQGLGHQMARGRCCECSTDPFAAATSLAPFPLLPSGHTAAWASGSAVSAIRLAQPLAWTGPLVAAQSEAALSLLLNPSSLHKCFLCPYDKPGTSFDCEESGGAEADMSRGPVKPAGRRERQTFHQ